MKVDNLQAVRTACFTGHRPNKLGGYEWNPTYDAVYQFVNETCLALIDRGIDTFITGMAIGTDQIAALAVLHLKLFEEPNIKMVCAVPFAGQERKWSQNNQAFYRYCLDASDLVHIVCDGDYEAWKMQKRNEWMVERSSIVVSVWDGSQGGTANCVHYAESKHKEIIRYHPGQNLVMMG